MGDLSPKSPTSKFFHLSKSMLDEAERAGLDETQPFKKAEFRGLMQALDGSWQDAKCDRLFDAASKEAGGAALSLQDLVTWLGQPSSGGSHVAVGCRLPLASRLPGATKLDDDRWRNCAVCMLDALPLSPKSLASSSPSRPGTASPSTCYSLSPCPSPKNRPLGYSPRASVLDAAAKISIRTAAPLVAGEPITIEVEVPSRKLQPDYLAERLKFFLVAIDVGAMKARRLTPEHAIDSKHVSKAFFCCKRRALAATASRQEAELQVQPQHFAQGLAIVAICVVIESSVTGRKTWKNIGSTNVEVMRPKEDG